MVYELQMDRGNRNIEVWKNKDKKVLRKLFLMNSNTIKRGYLVMHMPSGDAIEILTPFRAKPVKGFIRKLSAAEPAMRKSA